MIANPLLILSLFLLFYCKLSLLFTCPCNFELSRFVPARHTSFGYCFYNRIRSSLLSNNDLSGPGWETYLHVWPNYFWTMLCSIKVSLLLVRLFLYIYEHVNQD
jgi:hypothetical protein